MGVWLDVAGDCSGGSSERCLGKGWKGIVIIVIIVVKVYSKMMVLVSALYDEHLSKESILSPGITISSMVIKYVLGPAGNGELGVSVCR